MNLKNKRLSKKLTQQELAEKLGVARTSISMWEMGEAMPRAGKLAALAEVLGCTIDDLFAEGAAEIRDESQNER